MYSIKYYVVSFATCLKDFLDDLHEVSTVNFLLKMLHSLAPYPFLPPV